MKAIAEKIANDFVLDHRWAIHCRRITLGHPEGHRKTLVDLWEDGLLLKWTEQCLADAGDNAFNSVFPQITESLHIIPKLPRNWIRKYSRQGALPILMMQYQGKEGQLEIQSLGGETADLVKLTMTANKSAKIVIAVDVRSGNSTRAGLTPVNPTDNSVISIRGNNTTHADKGLIRGDGRIHCLSTAKSFPKQGGDTLKIELSSGKNQRTAWIVIPHRAVKKDFATLLRKDWESVWKKEVKTWEKLMASGTATFNIPDKTVQEAYEACLADLFILREPLAGNEKGVLAGTESYRCINVVETMPHVQAMLRAGFNEKAWEVAEPYLRLQEKNGRWDNHSPWMTRLWWAVGAIAIMYHELYAFTKDRQHGRKTYRQLLKLARWIHAERQKSKTLKAENPLYGLMPPGLGDSGLERDTPEGNRSEHVFYPHNSWTVAAIKAVLDFSRELGSTKEQKELAAMFKDAHDCLIVSMEKVSILSEGKPVVPVTPGHDGGSRWGSLVPAYPGGFLPLNHPLVEGALHVFENNLGNSGLPLNGGWLREGCWPGGCFEAIAPVYLQRGDIDKLTKMMYGVLNHSSQVWTWPEERAPETDTRTTGGDLQEAWAPVHFCRLFRDCLLYEEGSRLHLLAGVPRHWYESGRPIEVINAPSTFGRVSFHANANFKQNKFSIKGTIKKPDKAVSLVIHLNLPAGFHVTGSAEGNVLYDPLTSTFTILLPMKGLFSFMAFLEKK